MITIDDDEDLNTITNNDRKPITSNGNQKFDLFFEELKNFCQFTVDYCTVKYPSSTVEYTQLLLKCTFHRDFKVNLRIDYPKSHCGDFTQCKKLKIFVLDNNLKEELISYTNYLQRKNSVFLAVATLNKCFLLAWERKSILDMLLIYSEAAVEIRFYDCAYHIVCTDRKSGFKYFECCWKIRFDYVDLNVMDCIDFLLTKLDMNFYSNMKIVMNNLALPRVLYNTKVQQWWTVIQAANSSVKLDLSLSAYIDKKDYLRVASVHEIKCEDVIMAQSDDEDCIIVEIVNVGEFSN